LRQQLGDTLVSVDASAFPHAAAMVRLAAADFAAGKAVPPEQANLLYLRDKVALTISEQPRK
jgi:tRNA threonylcarbamoyladenosine biosynthesis protein TsaB